MALNSKLSSHYLRHVFWMPELQLGQDCLSTRDANFPSGLLLSVYNLAMVNDQGISSSTLAQGPVKLL